MKLGQTGHNPFQFTATFGALKTQEVPSSGQIKPDAINFQRNPYLQAANQTAALGINQPLSQPALIFWRDNQAICGGSKLFCLA